MTQRAEGKQAEHSPGLLFVWTDVNEKFEGDFNRWYDRELPLSEIPSAWPEAPNRAMKSIHAGPAQSDQVVAPRPGSIETIARGREFSSASSADSAASERAQTPHPT